MLICGAENMLYIGRNATSLNKEACVQSNKEACFGSNT